MRNYTDIVTSLLCMYSLDTTSEPPPAAASKHVTGGIQTLLLFFKHTLSRDFTSYVRYLGDPEARLSTSILRVVTPSVTPSKDK